MRKAVFFDRDGTIIEEQNYLSDPKKVQLIPKAAESIGLLRSAGFKTILVSNQSGVARGYFGIRDVEQVNARLQELLLKKKTKLDAIYFCPHYESGIIPEFSIACNCRKPCPGMALQAIKEQNLNPRNCYMVGDKLADIEFGQNFGAKWSFLVRTGHGATESIPDNYVRAEYVPTVFEAAQRILELERVKGHKGEFK